MAYHDVPIDDLNDMWQDTLDRLEDNPLDLDAVRQKVLLENEYQRQGWEVPKL
jgi:hypothetical protein